jgi:hypothetical protein
MTLILSPPHQRITLRNLSWETFPRLLSEHCSENFGHAVTRVSSVTL